MTPARLYQFFICAGLCINIQMQAQVNIGDSLALVDLFQQTGGTDWVNNSNWLAGPVATWHGVILSPDQTQVIGVTLPENNLNGKMPASIQSLFALEILDVFDNCLDSIPDLTLLPVLQSANIDSNKLGFASVQTYMGCFNPVIQFCNQKPAGILVDTIIAVGDSICLIPNVDGFGNFYQWYFNGVSLPPSAAQPDGSLKLDSLLFEQTGSYSFTVINDFVEGMVIEGVISIIEVAETDSTGALIKARQLILKFLPGIPQVSKDSIRSEFMATPLDSILCSDIDLWGFPDTIFLPNGDTLIEIEEIKNRAASKSKVEEVNYNHIVEEVDSEYANNVCINYSEPQISMNLSQDSVIVAVIDTGLDTAHPTINPYVWKNVAEFPDMTDTDGNCLIDDVSGFNFMDKSADISDENGHGTHVAGIIKDRIIPGNNVKLMALRTHDARGRGDLFAMMSAIFYASSRNARVINISSGYTGEASSILEIAIVEAADSSQSVVVCSAGNSGINNDTLPHYPSSIDVGSLISVAALNISETDLAIYTNFGAETVDIAAPGTGILSTLPGNLMGLKSGSSMSAGWVSGILANVIISNPDLTAEQVVNCTKISADVFPGGIGKLSSDGKINETAAIDCLDGITPGLRMNVYLEGPFINDSAGMTSQIFNSTIFPSSEPFTNAGWLLTEGGNDSIHFSQFQVEPVDWAIFELRDQNDSTTIYAQRPVVIRSDGVVSMPDGDSVLTVQGLVEDQYFVAIRFLRHLDCLTQFSLPISRSHPIFDFTDSAIATIQPGIFGIDQDGTLFIYTGDTNQDNVIDATDRSSTWNGRNQTGYLFFDVNLDGVCDAADRSVTWNNRNKSAGFPP